MSITADHLDKLINFLGYGTLKAPIWFLGLEEAFTERAGFSYADNLLAHSEFPRIIDVQDAHTRLRAEYWRREGPTLPVSDVWKWAAKLTLALLHNDPGWQDSAKVNGYIRTRLGRDDDYGGETLLLELLPLPKPGANYWPESYVSLGFESRMTYEERIRPLRIQLLRQLVTTNDPQPKYLFCYGRRNYGYYRDLVGDYDWDEKPLMGTQIWIKRLNATWVVLTPFFGNGALSTKAAEQLIHYLGTKS